MSLSAISKNKTAHGKILEKEFLNSFPDNLFVQRVKDDTLRFKNVQNFCDFIFYSIPHLFLFELKSTKQKSLPFSNISKKQIDTLFQYSNQPGIIAGFVINFRSHKYQTFFINAEKVHYYYYHAKRKSFPIEWVQHNGINLPATLIRTRYRFDLSPFLENRPV
jgi:penicillin-binding protein-related factor A (putative recombinase)